MHQEQAILLAKYNRWINQKIYQVCSELDESELKRDMGAFFKSIHGTLNHILLGDKLWFGRFTNEPFSVQSLDQELYSNYQALRDERVKMDETIIEWTKSLTDTELNSDLIYESMVNPAPRKCYLWAAITHFFNHQTHHRGQVTALLSQIGKDVGLTDILWVPGVVDEVFA